MRVLLVREAHAGQELAAALQRLGARLFLHEDRPFDHVLQRRAMRKQIEALEHHCNLRADRHNGRRIAIHEFSIHGDAAGVIALQPVDAPQDG
ncbi:hypothetical protein D3C87_1767550 [compost metagenome]